MPRLKAIFTAPFVVLFATGLAPTDDNTPAGERPQANRPAPSPPNPARLGQLLTAWENRSASRKSLEFALYQIDRDPTSGEQHYEGHAAFQAPKLGYLDIKKIKMIADESKKMVPQLDAGKKRVAWPLETLIWTTKEFWRYRYDTKQLIISRLDSGLGRRSFAEGPVPLLFNVKAADVLKRFEMVLVDAKDKQYLVKVVPKLERDQANFSVAWIVVDAAALLPARILVLSPDKESTQDFYLSRFQVNEPVKESFFRGVVPGKPWKIVHDRSGRAPAKANDAAARRPPQDDAEPPVEPEADQPR
jgi:hypothetical protein